MRSEDEERRKRYSIAAFFAGRSVFITGATGFMGKALVEKLLRSCPGINEIYLLIRPKKDNSIEERLKQMIENPLFDVLRQERPSSFAKLIPVAGDVSSEDLGLSPSDWQTIIDRVTVIYHVAANVRFYEDLKKDILSNTRSTRDICIMASSIKNLAAVVHVSTAYCQCDKPDVEEKVYPPVANWREAIEMAENMDKETLQIFAPKYIGHMPNTYTFSKRMAEQVISDYSMEIPCVILRPSIVLGSYSDPFPGWVDNFNGPIGLLIGCGKGLLHTALVDENVVLDQIPVDYPTKATLTATWKRGIAPITEDPDCHVYNCTGYKILRLPYSTYQNIGVAHVEAMPMEGMVWYPWLYCTTNRFIYKLLIMIFQIIPALIIDGALKLAGKKPQVFDLQRKIFLATKAFNFFTFNEWAFQNKNMLRLLWDDVPPEERDVFGADFRYPKISKYIMDMLMGGKRFLLHESFSQTEKLQVRVQRLKILHMATKLILLVLAMRWIYNAGIMIRIVNCFIPMRGIV